MAIDAAAAAQAEADAEAATEGEELPRVGEPSEPPQEFTSVKLDKLDENLYRGPRERLWTPEGARGVFGGQILGQSLAAAAGSVPKEKELHSMHSYFLRAGDQSVDIIYHVKRLRDGRNFATRVVQANQGGVSIFVLIASFQKKQLSSLIHQDAMPMVPSPESLPSESDYLLRLLDDPRCPDEYRPLLKVRAARFGPFDLRRVVTHDFFHGVPFPEGFQPPEYPKYTQEKKQIMWMRTHRRLPDDEDMHRSVLAYGAFACLLVCLLLCKNTAMGLDLPLVVVADIMMTID